MKTLLNGLLLTLNPSVGWRAVRDDAPGLVRLYLLHTIPFALIPAGCWYLGVTRQGWEFSGEVIKLTPDSALQMCVLFFFAMIAGVFFLGYMVHWMAASYASRSTLTDGVTLISYTASPFFLAGVLGLVPLLWIDLLVGMAVACYCIYLLYRGTPLILQVPRERGFLYASAVFAVALVALVGLMGTTIVLWDFGVAPEYTY